MEEVVQAEVVQAEVVQVVAQAVHIEAVQAVEVTAQAQEQDVQVQAHGQVAQVVEAIIARHERMGVIIHLEEHTEVLEGHHL